MSGAGTGYEIENSNKAASSCSGRLLQVMKRLCSSVGLIFVHRLMHLSIHEGPWKGAILLV
jgi:hypothetical protein